MNGALDTTNPAVRLVYFDSVNLSGAWVNDTGIQTGSCTSLACHGTDTLDWYGTGGWTLPACAVCHASIVGTRRQVLGSAGDFNRESHHVIDYSNPNNEIITAADCVVCHDMGSHMSGVLGLKNKDVSGQVIVYQAGNPSSLEPFCLSCHDSNGASTGSVPL